MNWLKIKNFVFLCVAVFKSIMAHSYSAIFMFLKKLEYIIEYTASIVVRCVLSLVAFCSKGLYVLDIDRLKTRVASFFVSASGVIKLSIVNIGRLSLGKTKKFINALGNISTFAFQNINKAKLSFLSLIHKASTRINDFRSTLMHSYSAVASYIKQIFAKVASVINPMKLSRKALHQSAVISRHSYRKVSNKSYEILNVINPIRLIKEFFAKVASVINPMKLSRKVLHQSAVISRHSYRKVSNKSYEILNVINPKRLLKPIVNLLSSIDQFLGRCFDSSVKFIYAVNSAVRSVAAMLNPVNLAKRALFYVFAPISILLNVFREIYRSFLKLVKKTWNIINPIRLINFLWSVVLKVDAYLWRCYEALASVVIIVFMAPIKLSKHIFTVALEVANKVVEIISNAVYGFMWVSKLPYNSMVMSGRVLALSTAHAGNYLSDIFRGISSFIARVLGAIRVYYENIKNILNLKDLPNVIKNIWNVSNTKADECVKTAKSAINSQIKDEGGKAIKADVLKTSHEKDSKFKIIIDKVMAIFRLIRMVLIRKVTDFVNFISFECKRIIQKHDNDISEVQSPIQRAINSKPNRAVMIMLVSVCILIVSFLIFAAIWEMPRYANAKGRIETYDQLQTIMALDGAVVEKVLVEEDQAVTKGQELIRFDKTVYQARYTDLQEKYYSKLGMIASLEARVSGIPLVLDEKIKDFSHRTYDDVISAHKAAIKVYEINYDLINNQVIRKEKEVEDARRDKALYIEHLALVKKQVDILSKLADNELVSKLKLIDVQKEMLATQIKLKNVESALIKTEGELTELENRKTNFVSSYNKDLLNDLTATRNEISGIVADMAVAKDLLNRSVIVSPINGVVYRISTRVVPGHAISGQEIISIVPSDGGLVMTGLVTPSEIGFVKKGQHVNIKIATYDYSIYGTLPGVVERISPETIQNKIDGLYYYEVVVRSEHNYIEHKGKKLYIKPGMDASADFDMDSRTLLRYMVDPFIKTMSEALSER